MQSLDEDTYEEILQAINYTEHDGFIGSLERELRQVERKTDEQQVLSEALVSYEYSSPTYVSEFINWLDSQLHSDVLPTVTRDLSRHGKCLSCGANDYPHKGRGCDCPVGFRETIYYNCLRCDREYTMTEKVENVPLCPSCRTKLIDRSKRADGK